MADIVKRESNLPEPIRNLIAGISPMPLVKTGAAIGAGFGAAMLGGKLLKQVDAVEKFASGGVYQDIATDFAGGLILDGLLVTGVWYATRKARGNDVALKVAKLMVVGTLLGAVFPNVAERAASGIDRAVDAIMGLFGMAPKGAPAPAEAALIKQQAVKRAIPGREDLTLQMSIGAPAGLYSSDLVEPGGIYNLSAS